MTLIVFLRGVNVGGHKTFQPSALAKDLAHLGAVNVGAAGTLVLRKATSAAAVRTELLRRLPFKPELMICSAKELLALAASKAVQNLPSSKDEKAFVSVMAKRPKKPPRLPFTRPEGNQWQVKVFDVQGVFALSMWRRQGKTLLYPNEVIEKHFAVPATTRSWSTVVSLCKILDERGS